MPGTWIFFAIFSGIQLVQRLFPSNSWKGSLNVGLNRTAMLVRRELRALLYSAAWNNRKDGSKQMKKQFSRLRDEVRKGSDARGVANRWGEWAIRSPHCLESFQALRIEREARQVLVVTLNWEMALGKPWQQEFAGWVSGKKTVELSSVEDRGFWGSAKGPPWIFNWVPMGVCMWKSYFREGGGKNHLKTRKKQSLRPTQGQELFQFLPDRRENQIIVGCQVEGVPRGICFSGGVKLAEEWMHQKWK